MSEHRSLKDHWHEIATPLEMLLPVLNGALQFGPSALVKSGPEAEVLTDHGRHFVRFVYHVACDAQEAAVSGWADLPKKDREHERFVDRAREVEKKLSVVVWISRALMETDLPTEVSADQGLRQIQELVDQAHEMTEDMDPRLRTRRAS